MDSRSPKLWTLSTTVPETWRFVSVHVFPVGISSKYSSSVWDEITFFDIVWLGLNIIKGFIRCITFNSWSSFKGIQQGLSGSVAQVEFITSASRKRWAHVCGDYCDDITAVLIQWNAPTPLEGTQFPVPSCTKIVVCPCAFLYMTPYIYAGCMYVYTYIRAHTHIYMHIYTHISISLLSYTVWKYMWLMEIGVEGGFGWHWCGMLAVQAVCPVCAGGNNHCLTVRQFQPPSSWLITVSLPSSRWLWILAWSEQANICAPERHSQIEVY